MRIFVVFVLLTLAFSANADGLIVKDGDIIFHTSKSAQSVAVQRATGSQYSHMGLIVHRKGKAFVFEAVATVRLTPLDKWITRGTGQHFVVKRLKNAEKILTPVAREKLLNAANQFSGRPYDITFGWQDDKIYCSELVWKSYDRALGIQIGTVQKLRDFNLQDVAVRQKLHERYGNHIPLDEPVISPKAMFESPLVVTVDEQ
ncbi:MAG: YiiX family permuted papain-like enzyme [Methylophilaceae bacterium]